MRGCSGRECTGRIGGDPREEEIAAGSVRDPGNKWVTAWQSRALKVQIC